MTWESSRGRDFSDRLMASSLHIKILTFDLIRLRAELISFAKFRYVIMIVNFIHFEVGLMGFRRLKFLMASTLFREWRIPISEMLCLRKLMLGAFINS